MISQSVPVKIGAPSGNFNAASVVRLGLYTENNNALSRGDIVIHGDFTSSDFLLYIILYPKPSSSSLIFDGDDVTAALLLMFESSDKALSLP